MKSIILAAVIFCCSRTLWAEDFSPPPANIFASPAYEMGVPEALVRAISAVESGGRPWVLNIEGQSFRFGSKKEALARAEEARADGRSFDVGLMQVNNWWLKKYDISLEAALDPAANVYFGAWILKEELRRHGSLRAVVGAYHSPTASRANRYADQVMAALEGKTLKNLQKLQTTKQKRTSHNAPKKESQKRAKRRLYPSPFSLMQAGL